MSMLDLRFSHEIYNNVYCEDDMTHIDNIYIYIMIDVDIDLYSIYLIIYGDNF